MFIHDLYLRQHEEGQNNQVQGQQNARCRALDPKCSLEGGSSGDLTITKQRQPGLSFGSLLMQQVPAI